MTHRGPFQPLLFCVILCYSLYSCIPVFTLVSSFEDTLKLMGSDHLRMGETWNLCIILNGEVFKSCLYCMNTLQNATYSIFCFNMRLSS